MNTKLKEVFRGKVVNKAHTINTGVDEFPRYVLEYLIDNYCAEETFHEDMEKVVRRLKENFVHGAEAEKIRHYIRENRHHSVIANLEARLVETEDKYWASISAHQRELRQHPGAIVRPVSHAAFRRHVGHHRSDLRRDRDPQQEDPPVQDHRLHAVPGERHQPRRVHRETPRVHDRRMDRHPGQLVRPGPGAMTRRQKLLYLCRCVPLVESNVNMVELAPRETGKTYLYRNISYYAHVLSGGKATPAQLFINLNTGKIGEVGTRDAVVLDEIANTDFTDPKALVSIMQGYMQDAKFSRGKKELLAFASLVFVGNIDVQGKLPHEKYYHLFEPLPDFLQVIAFLDRLHGVPARLGDPQARPEQLLEGLRLHHRLLLRDHARVAAAWTCSAGIRSRFRTRGHGQDRAGGLRAAISGPS